MHELPIANVGAIDIHAKRKDGGVDLFIVASGPLDGSPAILKLLLDKLADYLEFIKSPVYSEQFGEPSTERTRVILLCDYEIDPMIRLQWERSRPWAAENSASLEISSASALKTS
jgi:hypothetical protein